MMTFGVPRFILLALLALILGGSSLVIWFIFHLTSKK